MNCIIRNQVPYDYKQACNWTYNNNDKWGPINVLRCWDGEYQ